MTENIENVPQRLESKLFESVLKEMFDNFKAIKEFKTTPLSSDKYYETHFITTVEILVELEDCSFEKKSFILKTQCKSTTLNKEFLPIDYSSPDRIMYENIIPSYENLYQKVGKGVKFAPKYYRLNTSEDHLLLEDLSERGFKNVNRFECLDMQHAELVLQKLAQWHAASVVLKGRSFGDPSQPQYPTPANIPIAGFFESSIECLLKCLHLYDNPEQYREKIEKIQTFFTHKLLQASNEDENEINVVNHTNLNIENIMFQYDTNGQLLDTFFIDYTLPKYNSPARDLFHFILSSVQADIKTKQFDHFIRHYHLNLVENLRLLNYHKKTPTLREIHIMLHKYNIWGIHTALGILIAILSDGTETSKFDRKEDEEYEDIHMKLLRNKRYIKHMNVILPWLLHRGALEL